MLSDHEIIECFKIVKKVGGIGQVHAENGDVIVENVSKLLAAGITGPEGHPMSRPEEVEAEATYRACVIANQTKCPLYVVHVMSKSAANIIMAKRKEGNVIFGEPIAAGLACNGTHYYHTCWRHAAAYVMAPPLREDVTTPDFLMKLLADGHLQCTGTDNCTFTSKQKAMGINDFTKIPNGVNGLEDRMAVIWERGVHTGVMTKERFVDVTSTTAARIFNLYPQKGVIQPGSDADVVVWNPAETRTISAQTHHHAVDFNIFEGMNVHGIADYVITNGRLVVEEGELKVSQGLGRYIPTNAYSPYVYDQVRKAEEERSARELGIIRTEEDMYIDENSKMPEIISVVGDTSPKKKSMQETSFDLAGHPKEEAKEPLANRPTIDSKLKTRVREPPGGKSSITF